MHSTILTLGVLALAGLHVDAQGASGPDRTTAAGEAAIKDPSKECEPYMHPAVVNALASFPTIWQAATLLPNDNNAQNKWNAIKDSVPDIAPKGTSDGNFGNVNYSADDPDCWWTYSKCNIPKAPGVPADVAILPEPRTLGYGFDDGPNCSHNAFYDYLREQNQKATMFYIGSNVMDWPLEAARAVLDGHEICVHGWSHHYMTALQSEDAFAELYYKAVKLATGVTPTCWRPPYGDVDDRIRAIANGLGLRTVLWEYDSQDWQVGVTAGVTTEAVDGEYQKMIDDAKNGKFDDAGTMILMHEINDYTMTEAMKMYPTLKAAFNHIVPVCVGLNITKPYVESNYTFPTFEQYISGNGATLVANTTGSASASGSASSASKPAGTSSSVADNARKTGDASRLMSDNGFGGFRVVVAVVFGFICGVSFGLIPS